MLIKNNNKVVGKTCFLRKQRDIVDLGLVGSDNSLINRHHTKVLLVLIPRFHFHFDFNNRPSLSKVLQATVSELHLLQQYSVTVYLQ